MDAAAQPGALFTVTAVITDRACRANERAREHELPTAIVRLGDFPDRAAWNVALTAAVRAHQPRLVVSAGFMKILGAEFLAEYAERTLNTHPALLPAFPGAHAVRDALAYGVTITGCTVHLVDAGVDTGPILAQRALDVHPGDTEDTLHERIKVLERALVVETLNAVATGVLDLAAVQPPRQAARDVIP